MSFLLRLNDDTNNNAPFIILRVQKVKVEKSDKPDDSAAGNGMFRWWAWALFFFSSN